MAQKWDLLADAERIRWESKPLIGIGPVRFDMTREQVTAVVADVFPRVNTQPMRQYMPAVSRAIFSPPGRRWGGAITTYYDDLGLACIAAHARFGPQVTLFDMDLVCRVPSEIEDEFGHKSEAHGYELRYGPQADLGSPDLGIVLRTERAGDYARSRPVFVADRWTEMCADAWESRIPWEEWNTFLS